MTKAETWRSGSRLDQGRLLVEACSGLTLSEATVVFNYLTGWLGESLETGTVTPGVIVAGYKMAFESVGYTPEFDEG